MKLAVIRLVMIVLLAPLAWWVGKETGPATLVLFLLFAIAGFITTLRLDRLERRQRPPTGPFDALRKSRVSDPDRKD